MNIVVLTCILVAVPAAAPSPLKVTHLRCEYLEDPQGIDAARPRLGWLLESDRRGEVQSAYRVLVASSGEELSRDEGDLWDSGKVASDRSAQIEYAGRPLASRMVCSWKVRAWDRDGKPSAWSAPARFGMGLLDRSGWTARWIGCEIPREEVPDKTYLPCPYLRKEFPVRAGLRRARLYVTAAGLYELWINGKRVGEDFFTPGWTEYAKRLFYQTYDVTAHLREGAPNALGAILGDGWYGLHHGGRGRLRLLAQLEIEYQDGSREVIPTDTSWKTTFRGPLITSDIYQGESYDARKEMLGWSSPSFDDSSWAGAVEKTQPISTWADVTDLVKKAVKGDALAIQASNANFGDPIYGTPKLLKVEYALGGVKETKSAAEGQTLEIKAPAGGKLEVLKAVYGAETAVADVTGAILEAYPGSPVRRWEEIEPADPKEPKPGAFVLDMGQNFSGWVRLKVRGEAGRKVVLRFAEMLNPDGTIYTTNLRGARCTDTYVLKGGGEEVWEPRFTFHGFRYVEVTGYPGKPAPDALRGVVLHSNAPVASTFSCSNRMLNKLHLNIVWGQRSNYLEVPTDCPQRDERMGWTGDAQAFIGTGLYNQDLAAFFTAWLITLNDSQRADGGYTDVAPHGGGVSPGWSDAGIICPWTLWRMCGDTRVLERHYAGMARWIEYCENHSKDLLRPAEGYGDWLNVGAEMPKDVIATAYFAYSTSLLAGIARALGKTADAARYEDLLARIKTAFQNAYVAEDGRVKGDTQTTYLMALAFGLLPPEKRKAAENLLIQRIEERKWHLSTGFLGVNLLLPTLTGIGRLDVAYRLLQNEDFPSWGYPVKHGATTIWERWDGWTEEKGFQDPGMNSFNHYAYGSCGQWMFSTLAGIDTEEPGFQRLLIRPRPGGGLRQAMASYRSIHGPISVQWEGSEDDLSVVVGIPANTTATVHIPARTPGDVTEGGDPAGEAEGVKFLRMEGGAAVFRVGSGAYRFIAKKR